MAANVDRGFRDLSSQHPRYRLDTAFYEDVRACQRLRRESSVVAPLMGKGFFVQRGQVVRIVQEKGPQVAEVGLWNADDPAETYTPMRTRSLEGLFITTYTRMWSDLPWLRPMMTCVEDTMVRTQQRAGYHHHRFWTPCSAETIEMRTGRVGGRGCRTNFLKAVAPFGLVERHLRDSIVLFEKCRLDALDGKIYSTRSDARKGDYVELFAEIDVLVAVSVCPGREGGGDGPALPVGVEVYDTGMAPRLFPGWTEWRPGRQGQPK